MRTNAFIFALGVLLAGCAKEKTYQEEFKEGVFESSLLSSDPSDPYVYVPSVENTPMNVTASRPYWVGEHKLVVFKFREKQLEVLEIPTDKRFSKNENNFSPVFTLDVEHKDYRCAEDDFGECSNKEEEVKDASWNDKRFFKADFSKLTVLETNSLPEQLRNLFQKCFEDKGSVVKEFKLDADSLNITVERNMQASFKCADFEAWEDLRNLSFKVNHHYSFVKLSKLASQGYEPVAYPFADQTTFGYFTTTTKRLTADNRTTLDSDMTFMNRWNPGRKEIIYHLNDEFYEPGMDGVRAATQASVDTVNQSLAKAGVAMKIKLADGRGKKIGDLQNNFIVLVKDPQASGVVGYGPSITNPLTGEILKGQVVMYYGTIRKMIQDTYDEVQKEKLTKAGKADSPPSAVESRLAAHGKAKVKMNSEIAEAQSNHLRLHHDFVKSLMGSSSGPQESGPRHLSLPNLATSLNKDALKKEIFSPERILKHHDPKDMVEEMSRHNMYHESMVNWHAALQDAVAAGKVKVGTKAWNELDDQAKEENIEELLPSVWIPTLVHEIGHNLGLRHNFSGSEDKDNYFSKQELAELGMDREITYSSVMDYSYSSLNQLSSMGKYDLAALRFGYNRQVELKDGTVAPLPEATLEASKKVKGFEAEALKEYAYCTDEHTSVNPGCNRFDEGSTLEAMARHYVKAYKERYTKKNLRNNKLNFSSMSDDAYYNSIRPTFEGLRHFFELYDRLKVKYAKYPADVWEKNEGLKDIKAAAQVALDFYVEVLKTPSVHCALVSKETGELALFYPLDKLNRDLNIEATNCFDKAIELNPEAGVEIVGQSGKHLNHAREPGLRGDVKADPSQLDIRGIWMDKLLAAEWLTKRELDVSSYDDHRANFLDYPEFRESALDAILGLVQDKVPTKVEIEFPSGNKQPWEYVFDVGSTHEVVKSFNPKLNKALKIKRTSTDLRELVLPMVKKALATADDVTKTQVLTDSLSVFKIHPTNYVDTDLGDDWTVVELKKDGQSFRYALHSSNILAKIYKTRKTLDKIVKEKAGEDGNRLERPAEEQKETRLKLFAVYQARNKEPLLRVEEVAPEYKEVKDIEQSLLLAYLVNDLPDDVVMEKMLRILSQ